MSWIRLSLKSWDNTTKQLTHYTVHYVGSMEQDQTAAPSDPHLVTRPQLSDQGHWSQFKWCKHGRQQVAGPHILISRGF